MSNQPEEQHQQRMAETPTNMNLTCRRLFLIIFVAALAALIAIPMIEGFVEGWREAMGSVP